MAELVGSFGTSHSPVLISDVDAWPLLEPSTELPAIDGLVDVEAFWADHDARYKRAERLLHDAIVACRPDVLIVVGSDQGENFSDACSPSFEIFIGDTIEASTANRFQEPSTARRVNVPGHSTLGTEVVRGLCRLGFDVAWSKQPSNEFGIGHAITWPLRFLDLASTGIPILPIITNVWNPPNQPSVERCVQFGAALRTLIDETTTVSRVALLASGGLSHLVLDEELDRRVLDALEAGTREAWGAFSDAELYEQHAQHGLTIRLNGTAEISDWVVVGSCANTSATVIDYVPSYRTVTGLGVGMCFAQWNIPSA